jgi:DNA-nicking Smr family endonuclease
MKTSKSTGMFRPFEDLKTLLENQSKSLKDDGYVSTDFTASPEKHTESDVDIFYHAMADVKKISRDNCIDKNGQPPDLNFQHIDGDSEILTALKNLVQKGSGFVVANTPEYMEGRGQDAHPEITRRLHRGDFAVQDYIDLHGLNAADAQCAFEEFMKQNITAGRRVVLVIHGRGLSSANDPVLKTNVHRWLSSGYWRKWVMAFSSARWCDGGAGSTYVLLRQRPATKQIRKKWRAKRNLKP